MALKLGLSPQSSKSETFPEQLGRIGTATGLSALKGLENLVSFVPSLLLPSDAETLKQQTPSQMIQESAGLTPQYLEPQSLPERYLQRFAEYGPTSALTGGLAGLGRTAIGTGVASLLGQVGAPESIQNIAQLGTEIGTSAFKHGLRPMKIRKETRPKMERLYKRAEEEIKKVPQYKADNLSNFIEQELNNLPKSGLDKPARSLAKNELTSLGSDIRNGFAQPEDLWKGKKHLNKLIKNELAKTDPNIDLVNLYKRMVGVTNEALEDIGKISPKFGKPFTAAEDFFKGLDAPSYIRSLLEKSTNIKELFKKNPTLSILSTVGTLFSGKAPIAAAIYAANFPAREVARAYDLFTKSKQIQKYVMKISSDVANDSLKSAINNTIQLNKLIPNEKFNGKPKLKLGLKPA